MIQLHFGMKALKLCTFLPQIGGCDSCELRYRYSPSNSRVCSRFGNVRQTSATQPNIYNENQIITKIDSWKRESRLLLHLTFHAVGKN